MSQQTLTTPGADREVSLSHGVRLHYVEHGRENGRVAVMLHGYTDSAYSFSRLMPALPADRYRMLAVDQRGHGDSDRPADGYTIDALADDTVRFLDALDIGQATLIGHSMGSFVARRVAETAPDRVASLVLVGSAVTASNEGMVELRRAVHTLTDPVPADFVREFQTSTTHLPLPGQFLDRVVAESRKVPARVWHRLIDALVSADDGPDLSVVAAPTLVVCGLRDAVFSPGEHAALAAAIPGARLALYPDTGHAAHWERPERIGTDIDRFCRTEI